jgi:pSer/pThr/pTyr-binding forkhead associated (FHA) protein
MQVILKPVTHGELGEIIVKDNLFPIGRYEIPFSEYDARYVEKLSRRHARIFEQDGVVYIADLGSLNGTAVNGVSIDTVPMRLKRGDEICFTGYLCYHIDILGVSASHAPEEPLTPLVQLVLKPQKQQSLLEPIVVTRFPFLINKTSDVFSRYKDLLPDEINYISRRHAHIFLKGKDVYVEDLGSTNGTFVSGTPLDEHARILQDGDVIAFGGETFLYTVCLHITEQDMVDTSRENNELLTSTAHAIDDVTRTTFVSSANSFLDIFCTEGDQIDAGQHEAEAAAGKTRAGKEARPGDRSFNRFRTMLGEVRNAFSDKGKERSGKAWLVAVAIAIVGIVVLIVYFSDRSTRDISDLLQRGAYEGAAVKANRYLEMHPDDQEITDLATQSALKQVVPDWVEYVTAGKFTAAESAIEQGVRLSYANPQGQQLFAVLTWVTRLEQFISDRGSPDPPVTIFKDEDSINELVGWWDEDPKGRRRSLATISQYVPEFMEYRQQIFSHLRALQNHQSLSIAAIERLVEQVRAALRNGNAQSLREVLSDFGSRYPRIQGIGILHRDLDSYLPVELDLQGRNWIKARQTVNRTSFETQVFQDWVRLVARDQLPTETIMTRYNQALADWQQGNTELALAELGVLSEERWGDVAERSLQRMQQVISDFNQLNLAKGKAGYDRQLLSFYRTLDPAEDIYFAEAVAEELQLYKTKALDDAARQYTTAEESWKEYLASGGIRGLHRLEARVSATYRRLAAQLSSAYDAMSKSMEIHKLLGTAASPERDALYADISREVKLQRQSLNELEMVLEPSLRTTKLGLLPVPEGARQNSADDRQGEQ